MKPRSLSTLRRLRKLECDMARDVYLGNLKLECDAATATRFAQADFNSEMNAAPPVGDFDARLGFVASSWLQCAHSRVAASVRTESEACHAGEVALDILVRCRAAVAAIDEIVAARALATTLRATRAEQAVVQGALLRQHRPTRVFA